MKSARSDESILEIETSWGVITVKAREALVVSCDIPFVASEPSKPLQWGKSIFQTANSNDQAVLKQADQFIRGLFQGEPLPPPPFAWPKATVFTSRVWKALVDIPRGRTAEYGELARQLGCPGGARAVGRACGANPLPLFIPCHRVLPRNGSLGGFSCGLPWKRLLLEVEKKA
jgi:methylated-DNA-[protein]-cysteine S-methyltransferase